MDGEGALRGGAISYVACRYLVLSGFNASNHLDIVIGEEGSLPAIALYGSFAARGAAFRSFAFHFRTSAMRAKGLAKIPSGHEIENVMD